MKTEEKVIDGVKYTMHQVGAETGDEIVLRLARPMAALFSKVADRAMKQGLGDTATVSLAELVVTGAGPALQAMAAKDLRFVRRKLAACCTVYLPDGKQAPKPWPLKDHYDDHFRGRYQQGAQWLLWGLKMNHFFGDALERLEAMLAAYRGMAAAKVEAKAEAASRSSSPKESGGGPGASSSTSTAAPD